MKWNLFVLSALISLPFAATAQTPPPTDITNKPFSAQQWTTSTFVQPDGSTGQLSERVDVSRASSGSTRYDSRILSGSGSQIQATGSAFVDIRNVPNHLIIHLDPDTSTARIALIKTPKHPPLSTSVIPSGAAASGPPQDLGTQQIAGYTVTGARQAFTYSKGTLSQTQDVTQTVDTWYSPDVQTVIQKSVTDGLGNASSMSLAQITTSEPDPALFVIPPNYVTAPNPPVASK